MAIISSEQMKGRSIRIECDGTSNSVRVYDLASGIELKGLCKVEWSIEVNSIATAKLTFVMPNASLIAEVTDVEYSIPSPDAGNGD
jgi:hypothetical protein